MKIQNVKNGDTIGIFTTCTKASFNAFLMENVKINYCYEKDVYDIIDEEGNEFIFDERKDSVFSTLEEAIDCIRYIDYINLFNETTFTYYLPHLKEYIDEGKYLYGVRRHKNGSKDVIKYKVIGLKYDHKNYGKWKIKLETEGNISSIPYATLYYNAENLGKTLFFSFDNAMKRC